MTQTTLADARETLILLKWPPAMLDALYRFSRNGDIPSVQIGRRRFWNPEAISQWVANGGTKKQAE